MRSNENFLKYLGDKGILASLSMSIFVLLILIVFFISLWFTYGMTLLLPVAYSIYLLVQYRKENK